MFSLFPILKKSIDIFYNKYGECKQCNIRRNLKRFFENNENLSNQQKKFYEKNRDNLLQKQNNRYNNYKEIHGSYVEIKNKRKAMEEKFTINDQGNKKNGFKN